MDRPSTSTTARDANQSDENEALEEEDLDLSEVPMAMVFYFRRRSTFAPPGTPSVAEAQQRVAALAGAESGDSLELADGLLWLARAHLAHGQSREAAPLIEEAAQLFLLRAPQLDPASEQRWRLKLAWLRAQIRLESALLGLDERLSDQAPTTIEDLPILICTLCAALYQGLEPFGMGPQIMSLTDSAIRKLGCAEPSPDWAYQFLSVLVDRVSNLGDRLDRIEAKIASYTERVKALEAK